MAKLTKEEKHERKYQFLVDLGKKLSKENREKAGKWELIIFKLLSDLHINFQFQLPHIHRNKLQKLYILDFLLTDYNIVLEIDGKQFHSSKEDKKKDSQRTRHLKKDGFHVLRLWNSQVTLLDKNQLLQIIEMKVKSVK